MIKTLGIRAHDFGKMESSLLAKIVIENKLNSVQLALNKAIKGIDEIEGAISSDNLDKIAKDFKENKVDISVLGCYLNYAHPNVNVRNKNVNICLNHLEYAKRLGARVVGTETGSVLEAYTYHPNNHTKESYETFRNSLEKVVTKAEDLDVQVAIEGVAAHIIHDNQTMKRLLDEIKSNHLKVILDPVNLLTSENYLKQEDVVKEAFDLFGDVIQIIHAKDFRYEQGKFIEISHGTGSFNYDVLIEMIAQSKQKIDILLENPNINKLDEIRNIFKTLL